MGKRKHIKSGAGDVIRAPTGLADQIEVNSLAQQRAKPRGILKKGKLQDGEFVPDVLSAKILREASKQLAREEPSAVPAVKPNILATKDVLTQLRATRSAREDSEDSGSECDLDDDEFPSLAAANPPELPDFLHNETEPDRTLDDFASTVIQRAHVKKFEFEREFASGPVDPKSGLSENVVQMYTEIGEYMSYYRTGKIPKAFKSIPALKNWEQILEFYRFYLLPRVLDDILQYRKLNVHLFTALKKSVYKPTAFVKGILLPMCDPDTISMNAAHVMKAVIQSTSLPVFHAATAMIKLAQNRPVSSPVSYILTGFIHKRYTLPSLVMTALVDYFCSYDQEDEPMPVSLHASLHTFVQHYKLELSAEQKRRIHQLLTEYGNKNARKDTLDEIEPLLTEEHMDMS